jgi:RNA polymerase sigma-70 factor, ECF subfamily
MEATGLLWLGDRRKAEGVDEDAVLVGEFTSGNSAAFDALYHKHAIFVYNTCLGMVGNPEDARDAMQDTFVSAYKGIRGFHNSSKFSTWLYRIAVNRSLDMMRKKGAQAGDSVEWLNDASRSQEERARERAVREAVLRLKPHHRTALVLHYFQGLTCEEIAECTGWTPGKAATVLHRARKSFRSVYADEESEDEQTLQR